MKKPVKNKYEKKDNNAFKEKYNGFYMGKSPLCIIVLFGIIIGFIGVVYAVPMIPVVFSGEITYTGNPSMNLEGYDINVSMPGKSEWNVGTVGTGNRFEIDVDPYPASPSGNILFIVGGSEANEVGNYIKGGFIELDLTIDNPPSQVIDPQEYCGDGICNNGETCSTCSQDCGSCDDGDDDGDDDDSSGGGGSSGSSSSSDRVIVLSNDNTDSDSSGTRARVSPMTGDVVGSGTEKEYGFFDFLESGGLIVILAGLIIILGIILLLLPRK